MVLLPLVLCCALLGSTGVHAAGGSTQYAQAQRQASEGHYTAAVHAYEQAILQGHNDPYTYWRLGLAYGKVKRWDDAVWAISTALTDDNFTAEYPRALQDLQRVSAAGGVSGAPPTALRQATMSPAPAFRPNPAQQAVEESKAAFSSLQTEAFFVAPAWNRQITWATSSILSAAARRLSENDAVTAKFAFLGATPEPYTSLTAYTKDLFTHLHLQHAVLVIVTPQRVSAYSDMLDASTAQRISDEQLHAMTLRDPAALAASIATAVNAGAKQDATANTQRSLVVAGVVIVLILAAVAIAISRLMHNGAPKAAGIMRKPGAAGAR